MSARSAPSIASLTLLLAIAAPLPARGDEPRGGQRQDTHHCTARFYDRQDGELLEERKFPLSGIPAKMSPESACLSHATKANVEGAMVFVCHCERGKGAD